MHCHVCAGGAAGEALRALALCGPLQRSLRALDLSHNPRLGAPWSGPRWRWALGRCGGLQLLDVRYTGAGGGEARGRRGGGVGCWRGGIERRGLDGSEG